MTNLVKDPSPAEPTVAAGPVPPRRRTPQASVLYDAPGPRARRVTLIASLITAALLVVLFYVYVYRPLDANGQFTRDKWGPLFDPSFEFQGVKAMPLVWKRIAQGFGATLAAAGAAIVTSLIFGTLLAILRIQLKALRQRRYAGLSAPVRYLLRALTLLLNGITRFCVEIFRGLPVVITIFFVGRGLPRYGIEFDNALWYVVIGLTVYNMVVIAEILRSGMEGLPSGQREAALSIGLSSLQTTFSVLLPQSYRIMLPALISQLVVVLKDTSLGFLVSYEEMLNVADQLNQNLQIPIQIYFVVGVIYILLNYALSKLAQYTQARLARGRRTALVAATAVAPAAVAPPEAGGAGGVAKDR